MSALSRASEIRLAVGADPTTARLYRAASPRSATLVLAHGAGAGQAHRFMVGFAAALAERGIDVVTFDFLYIAAAKRAPDRPPKLEACWRAAYDWARGEWPRRLPFVGGKSMGGWIASMMVAAGQLSTAGLVLLGYPLKPPKSDQLRAAHLGQLSVPTLVVQGQRDEFGSPDVVRAHFAPSAEVVGVRGGHSYDEAAWPEAQARVADFILRAR